MGHSPVPGDATECSVPRTSGGAANPSREMGYVLQKDFSLPPHHTVSKPRTLQLSGEMKCCKLWGILGTETLRSSTVKCPIIPTCSIKAGPTVCDSSKERQPFMSLSTFTELVLDRHTWNSCTEFIVSRVLPTESRERHSYGMKTVLLPTPGSLWEPCGNSLQPTSTTGIFTMKF